MLDARAGCPHYPGMPSLPAAHLEIWTARLAREAAGLDLADPEDRVTFRCRVSDAFEPVRCDMIRALAVALGRQPADLSRHHAARAVADAWIARVRGTHVCKAAAS